MNDFWKRKLAAYLHDPPEKALDLAWHKQRAENYERGLGLEDTDFARDCDHTAAAADRLPWPRWQFLESAFDGRDNHFKHPLGRAKLEIPPYSHADIAHHLASMNQPKLTAGDDAAQFLATWRLWRWWASDNRDSRLAFLPADTRLPDHTIWVHNSIVSALQSCVTGEGGGRKCRPAFLLFQIGPVQDYIAQARRTLDLWSGSYLLSYLIGCGLRHIAVNYGPDNVIFPNLCGQPIFDLLLKDKAWTEARVQLESSGSDQTLWDCFGYESDYGRRRLLTPSLPNRFLAVLPADQAGSIAQEVVRVIREQHGAIANEVWMWAEKHLSSANCWTKENRDRYMAQNKRFLDIAWQVVPWPDTPDESFECTSILPDADKHASGEGPRASLHTILEMARQTPPNHRDVRNFICESHCAGTRNAQGRDIGGWKDRSKLKPDAKLDNPGAAWSALYPLVNWQLDAVRQSRAWKAWAEGGWQVGRDRNKDSLNGKEEAILAVGTAEEDAKKLNDVAGIPNLFKAGELLGASSLIKRLWPTAWLQDNKVHRNGSGESLFKRGDFSMPDTRSIAAGLPFDKTEEERDVELLPDDGAPEDDSRKAKYFAVLALDGDEMGKWISGLHPNMPTLGVQLADYAADGERKGAKKYFEEHGLKGLLGHKRPLSPSFHLQFSEMLANFGNYCVRRIVEASDGRLIYSGGDDVLALLPAQTALGCAAALRAAFQGQPGPLNQLKGAWRVRPGGAEKDSQVRLFDFSQAGFIQLDRNLRRSGFALEGEPLKFPALVPGPAADCSVGIAIAHFKAPLQDVIRAAQDAEKRAKKQLGRSAVAVTLMKRSGETIEWGCQWDSGGLAIYRRMAAALANEEVSAKFPHRICELLTPYLTSHTPLSVGAMQRVDAFEPVPVIRQELDFVIGRQGKSDAAKADLRKLWLGERNDPKRPSLVEEFCHWATEQEGRLAAKKAADLVERHAVRAARGQWLREIGETRISAESKLAKQTLAELDKMKALTDLALGSLPAQAGHQADKLQTRLQEAPIQALIGLCQTVAFAHRTRDGGGNLPSAIPNLKSPTAERQPA